MHTHTTRRTTSSALAAVLVASLSAAAGCGEPVGGQAGGDPSGGGQRLATSEVALTAGDEGAAAQVGAGKVLTVRLPGQPAAGYVWDVEQIDRGVLRPLDEAHEMTGDLSGGAAVHVHRFLPAGRGRTRLKLVYHRPWETDVPPAQTYAVDVDVDGAYAGPTPAPLVAPSRSSQALSEAVTATDLPSHYSACEPSGCTPIKDQGQCGSCWAFATVGVVEQLVKVKDGQTRDLSEQYLVSCNTRGWGCNGGGVAFDLFTTAIPSGEPAAGAVYEASFPYAASDAACNPPHAHHEKLVSYASVGTAVADIKNAILAHGPIFTAVCADSSFSRYTSGVFAGSGCTSLNHGVVLVGWDDNGGQGYWILRNSWGSRWGQAGYMNIRWGANAIGSRSNTYATYAGSGACTPTTCAAQGKSCGTLSDGCGGALACGSCPAGQTCSSNVCTASTCTPTTCAAQGKDCGTISDGCGGTLSCGTCTSPRTCGGGGVANVCGGGVQACATPYAKASCTAYATGTKVSAGGHDWTCASRYCTACSRYASCAPGASGCPWGAVWTDDGACP